MKWYLSMWCNFYECGHACNNDHPHDTCLQARCHLLWGLSSLCPRVSSRRPLSLSSSTGDLCSLLLAKLNQINDTCLWPACHLLRGLSQPPQADLCSPPASIAEASFQAWPPSLQGGTRKLNSDICSVCVFVFVRRQCVKQTQRHTMQCVKQPLVAA